MTPRFQLLLLGGAILGLLVLAYALQDAPASGAVNTPVAAATPPVQPSSNNVDPSFHTQLMALQQQVEDAPDDTTHLARLARMQQDGHRMEEAAASYERLIALAPDHRQAHLDLALVYGELGRWDDARRVTRALLAQDGEDPSGLYNLGAIAANTGDYDEARSVWLRVQAQARDAEMAQRATSSLQQLDALATQSAPAPTTAPAQAPSGGLAPVRERMNGETPAASQPMPAGHPPVAGRPLQPILAGQ